MRLFIYEYLSFMVRDASPESASLRREGLAMLTAALADAAALDGVRPVTMVRDDLVGAIPCVEVHTGEIAEENTLFHDVARSCDAALVIAPELQGRLTERTVWLSRSGCFSLGSRWNGVARTSSKLATFEDLRDAGVPTPRTATLADAQRLAPPILVKAQHGAGSVGIARVTGTVEEAIAIIRAEGYAGELIAQEEHAATLHASVAVLVGPGRVESLPCVRQNISHDGRFRYSGGSFDVPGDVGERLRRLAERAVQSISGMNGYVGVDLVSGPDGDAVIEINPRLTTSYVGYRRMTRGNVLGRILAVVRGEESPPLVFDTIPLTFRPDDPTTMTG